LQYFNFFLLHRRQVLFAAIGMLICTQFLLRYQKIVSDSEFSARMDQLAVEADLADWHQKVEHIENELLRLENTHMRGTRFSHFRWLTG
jgi:hypothetical protein